MALFRKRVKRAVRSDQLEAQTGAAIQAFMRQLRAGEEVISGILGFPQLPNPDGAIVTAPLALAVVTNQVFALADPSTGVKHGEYPLVHLHGFMNKPDGDFLLQFAATPDLLQLCAFTPLPASDWPPMMNALAGNGFVIGLVDTWKAQTHREFVNGL